MPGDASSRWTATTLGDATTWLSGGTPSKSVRGFWGGTIPWVSPKDMKVFRIGTAQDWVTEAGVLAGSRLVPDGVTLLVVRGMILAHTFPVCLTTRPVAFNQDVKAVVPGPDVDGTFLAHWFVGHSERMLGLVTEATHGTKRIELADLLRFPLSLPPPPEQRRIVEVLDTLDLAILKTEQIVTKLQQVKLGLIHDLLTCGLDENGELRDAKRYPNTFKHSPVGQIPATWNVWSLGALVRRHGGLIQTGPFGSQLHAREYVREGVPVVMPQDITEGLIDEAHVARVSSRKAWDLRRHALRENDAVFARRGDLSRCTAITALEAGWLCGTGCLLVRLPDDALSSDWLTAVYRHHIGQRQILGLAVGSTMANLNGTILASLQIPVPPLKEQLHACRRLESIQVWINRERAELQKLIVLKSGLMKDLLAHKVQVRVSDEVAA